MPFLGQDLEVIKIAITNAQNKYYILITWCAMFSEGEKSNNKKITRFSDTNNTFKPKPTQKSTRLKVAYTILYLFLFFETAVTFGRFGKQYM